MPRRMFALLGEDGAPVEYVSPDEGQPSGRAYVARLEADPAHVEVDPETREQLVTKAPKAARPTVVGGKTAEAKA